MPTAKAAMNPSNRSFGSSDAITTEAEIAPNDEPQHLDNSDHSKPNAAERIIEWLIHRVVAVMLRIFPKVPE